MGFSFIEDFTSIQGIVCAVVTQTKMTNYKSFFFCLLFSQSVHIHVFRKNIQVHTIIMVNIWSYTHTFMPLSPKTLTK